MFFIFFAYLLLRAANKDG